MRVKGSVNHSGVFPTSEVRLPPAGIFLVPARKVRKNRLGEALTVKPIATFSGLARWHPGFKPPTCCGARQKLHLSKQARFLPTAATRSGRFFRHWRRSLRSPRGPSRPQSLPGQTSFLY